MSVPSRPSAGPAGDRPSRVTRHRPPTRRRWPARIGAALVAATCLGGPSVAQAGATGAAAERGPASAAGGAGPLRLHVPSPDWRDQIVYFVVTDRFDDGDPANNDQGAGEHRPGDRTAWQGGDLKGVTRRLDYIRGLGATAVWITPPVAQQWVDGALGYTGYHGYWARHFTQVDPHLGTLADYRRLSDALHRRGMYLVQDIVVNHVGDYFGYGPGWSATDPARDWRPNTGARPTRAPTQAPFHLNDPRRPADRRAAIYHWTPAVADYGDPDQERRFQMSGLDDLNTTHPAVRRALRASYGHWIREVGVDAFRVDTAFYVEPDFFTDFRFARDRRAPGIDAVARATGRRDFLSFGEGFAIDRPGRDDGARKIESYVRAPDGRPRLDGMLNFPLYGALADAFARGEPAAVLGDRIRRTMATHARPHRMPTFVDNHDVDRFLAGGTEAGLRQALLALMTLPGIPVLYYGTEQGFTEPRASMFAAGWGSGGRDRFDTASPLYRFVADVTALRRGHPVLSRGRPTVLRADEAGPGLVAWRMDAGPDAGLAPGTPPLLVVMNTADEERLLDGLDAGRVDGRPARWRGVWGLQGRPADAQPDAGGRVTLRVPARGGLVFALEPAAPGTGVGTAGVAASLALDPLPASPVTGDVVVRGRAEGVDVAAVSLVVDGDLSRTVPVGPVGAGGFEAVLPTGRMTDPAVVHRVVAWAEGRAVSAPLDVRADLPWRVLAEADDPEGDDHGATPGLLRYPTDPSYAPRQMDLRRVRVLGAGGALRVEATMRALTTTWSPALGFDHVAFTLFVELPPAPDGRRPEGEGARVMPGQDGELPGDLRWHRRLRAHGWGHALFAPEGADARTEGRPVVPGARVEVDRAAGVVRFTLPAQALGDRPTLAGARVWLTTWDWDGGYRPVSPAGGPFVVGGPAGSARWMDASPVLTLR